MLRKPVAMNILGQDLADAAASFRRERDAKNEHDERACAEQNGDCACEPTTKFESVRISELQPGDVVWTYGMRLRCGEFHVSQSHPKPLFPEEGETRWCKAEVLNPDDVRAAKYVPESWWVDGWTLQSNDYARWTREVSES